MTYGTDPKSSMRIYIDRRLGDVHDVVSLSETLVFVQEAYPDAADYRPGARLPVDFRRLEHIRS